MARSNKAEAHAKPQTSRGRAVQSRAADLDRLIHEPIRLGIVSALAVNEMPGYRLPIVSAARRLFYPKAFRIGRVMPPPDWGMSLAKARS